MGRKWVERGLKWTKMGLSDAFQWPKRLVPGGPGPVLLALQLPVGLPLARCCEIAAERVAERTKTLLRRESLATS